MPLVHAFLSRPLSLTHTHTASAGEGEGGGGIVLGEGEAGWLVKMVCTELGGERLARVGVDG